MARKKSELPEDLAEAVRKAGFVFEIFQKLAVAVASLGGNLEHVRRIIKEPALVMMLAQLLVGGVTGMPTAILPQDHYRVLVNYVLPSMNELKKSFDFVSDLWDGREWKLHESLKGVAQVPGELIFLLKKFGKQMSSEAVIAWAEANGYRVATHLEALAFARANPEIQRSRWYVALGSFALSDSRQCVAYLDSSGSERLLTDRWFDCDWHASTLFLLVRK
jgi:hypothetical protein